MIPEKFVRKIGAQTKRTAQRKNLKRAGRSVKCGSAGGIEKQRGLVAQTHEVGTLHIHLTDRVRQIRTLAVLLREL